MTSHLTEVVEEILADFEQQGEGRVRFLWNRPEAREWIKSAHSKLLSAVVEEIDQMIQENPEGKDWSTYVAARNSTLTALKSRLTPLKK